MHRGTAQLTYFFRLNELSVVTSVFYLGNSARKLSGLGKNGWLVHQILKLLLGGAQTVWRKKGPSRQSKASRHSSSSSEAHPYRTEPNSSGPQPSICPGLPHMCSRLDHPHGALLPSLQPRCWCAMSWGCCQQQ